MDEEYRRDSHRAPKVQVDNLQLLMKFSGKRTILSQVILVAFFPNVCKPKYNV